MSAPVYRMLSVYRSIVANRKNNCEYTQVYVLSRNLMVAGSIQERIAEFEMVLSDGNYARTIMGIRHKIKII